MRTRVKGNAASERLAAGGVGTIIDKQTMDSIPRHTASVKNPHYTLAIRILIALEHILYHLWLLASEALLARLEAHQ